MVLVHDDDLAHLHGIYDGTVSRSPGCTLIMTIFNFFVADRICPTRCDVRSPPKRAAEDLRVSI